VKKERILVQFDRPVTDRLREMANRYGYSVAALVRNCVEARLNILDQQLARKAAQTQEPKS